MIIGLIAAFITALLWTIACIVFMHCYPATHRVHLMIKLFFCSLPFLALLLFFLQHQPIASTLNGTEAPALAYLIGGVVYLLFFLGFLECFFHIDRSITLRLLIEIQQHPSFLTATGLMNHYPVDVIIKRRLQEMLENGWLYQQNDRWKLTSKGRLLTCLLSISTWIFQSKTQDQRL